MPMFCEDTVDLELMSQAITAPRARESTHNVMSVVPFSGHLSHPQNSIQAKLWHTKSLLRQHLYICMYVNEHIHTHVLICVYTRGHATQNTGRNNFKAHSSDRLEDAFITEL